MQQGDAHLDLFEVLLVGIKRLKCSNQALSNWGKITLTQLVFYRLRGPMPAYPHART